MTDPDPDRPNPWARSRRDRLPAPIPATSRPTEATLLALRSRVESGCPFDLARRVVGVSESVHAAWLERGLALHDAQPDRTYRPDGTTVLAGSLEPEAEYVRIYTTVQAGAAATLVEELWKIARDPKRKRDQLTAISLVLRGMGERAFDPRSEQDVSVVARDERPSVDQATVDAMTPAERIAITAASRAMAEQIAAAEAAIGAAKSRAAATDSAELTSDTGAVVVSEGADGSD